MSSVNLLLLMLMVRAATTDNATNISENTNTTSTITNSRLPTTISSLPTNISSLPITNISSLPTNISNLPTTMIMPTVPTTNSSLPTTTMMMTTVPTIINDDWDYNDDCTNECNSNDNRYWCGKYRKDPHGFISRCVQYTYRGEICVTECGVQAYSKSTACRTNFYKLDSDTGVDWWDYCSLSGYTINKQRCWDNCELRGERYFWCRTSGEDKSKWDYCSPDGLVKPLQIHRKGGKCINECGKHGKKYFWCYKSRKYCHVRRENCDDDGTNCDQYVECDDDWEYCSVDDMHTRYGVRCKDRCSRAGESYNWCYTVDGSWDYCSPKARDGVHISLEVEVTRYNKKCFDVCGQAGYSYFWCQTTDSAGWDYCSPEGRTIYNKKCKDSCKRREENYFWCHTADSWDYCSPRSKDDFSYSSISARGDADIVGDPVMSIIICIVGIAVLLALFCCLRVNKMPPFNN